VHVALKMTIALPSQVSFAKATLKRIRWRDDLPVEMRRPSRVPHRRRLREKREHEADEQKRQRDIVERRAPFPQRPSARQERLAAEALEAHAADGDDVGEDEGGVGDVEDGVEGCGGAEVDGAQEEGDAEADEELVWVGLARWVGGAGVGGTLRR